MFTLENVCYLSKSKTETIKYYLCNIIALSSSLPKTKSGEHINTQPDLLSQ